MSRGERRERRLIRPRRGALGLGDGYTVLPRVRRGVEQPSIRTSRRETPIAYFTARRRRHGVELYRMGRVVAEAAMKAMVGGRFGDDVYQKNGW